MGEDLQLDGWDEPESEEHENADQDIPESQCGNAEDVDGKSQHQVEQEADAGECCAVENGIWPEAAGEMDGRAEERGKDVAEQQSR